MISKDERNFSTDREAVSEINRLHRLAEEKARCSIQNATEAVSAAWEAGKLLDSERKRIRQECGHGAWEKWVRLNFEGSLTTAKRYMRVFKSATSVADLPKGNLNQTYRLMGISHEREPEVEGSEGEKKIAPVDSYLMWAQKLTAYLQKTIYSGLKTNEEIGAIRRDMLPLIRQLNELFKLDRSADE
ncbi:MAG: hypothetical protein QM790_18870 [Nibricoccus sp.]